MARMPARLGSFILCLFLCPGTALADAPSLLLALPWSTRDDPAGWWMSEKYDGVRGYWDGRQMWSRQGQQIALPEPLRDGLPAFPLDGELWAGRGQFSRTVSVVRSKQPDAGWEAIRYMVFDVPAFAGPFEKRMQVIRDWLEKHPSGWVRAVEQIRCRDSAHLQEFLRSVESRGGEGVMLRAAGSQYVAGRSPALRKLKSFDDAEAKVTGYRPGKGKYAGAVGSLLLELPNGVQFAAGSGLSDHDRQFPPAIGTWITFRHHGWTRHGKPRFPVYWRVHEPLDGRSGDGDVDDE